MQLRSVLERLQAGLPVVCLGDTGGAAADLYNYSLSGNLPAEGDGPDGRERSYLLEASELIPMILKEGTEMDELPELAATPIAPVGYTCADLWGEEAEAPLAAADVAFSYSVTWESEEGYLTTLSSLLARRLSDGARACTVDLKLRSDADASFDLLATVTGCNPETGEGTVGYVWRVRKPP